MRTALYFIYSSNNNYLHFVSEKMWLPEVWGTGSILVFLIIVAILLFGPLFMGSVSPPGILLLLVFPVVLAAVIIFLIIVTNN